MSQQNVQSNVKSKISVLISESLALASECLNGAPKDNATPLRDRNTRKYPCKLCDRAFDRPSTLKTHLLVHTGVTPFSCHICGRRFSIRSNRNRHVRRCTIRQDLFLARRTEFQGNDSSIQMQLNDIPIPRKFTEESQHDNLLKSNDDRGQRRKPCALMQWIPVSLLSFTILSRCLPSSIPLPAAKPYGFFEERNSYGIYHSEPYVEKGWSGQLPGPSYIRSGGSEGSEW